MQQDVIISDRPLGRASMQSVARLAQVFLLSAVCLSKPAGAANIGPDFLVLLRLVPDAAETYETKPLFSYVDIRAIERASGLPRSPGTLTRSGALPAEERQRWEAAMQRVVHRQDFTNILHLPDRDRMRELVGFDRLEIDRALSFGDPPDDTMILQGSLPDAERLQATLAPRGFERREIGGVPVLHRFEDNSVNLTATEPADPFGGSLGGAARIAVVRAGLLAWARNWPRLEKVLAVATGSGPTTRMVPLVEALLPGLRELGAEADPSLLQAWAFSVKHLAWGASDPLEILEDLRTGTDPVGRLRERFYGRLQPGAWLLPYPLAFLFDLQAGKQQINVIALPYPDRESAAMAADVLAERLATWSPSEADGGKTPSLVEATGGTIERRVIAVPSDSGSAFALVAVRYPLPTSEQPAGSAAPAGRNVPGSNLRAWFSAIDYGQFSPLFFLDDK